MNYSNWKDIFQYLSSPESHHNPRSDEYTQLKQEVRHEVEKQFAEVEPEGIEFGPFGKLVFPYFQMGNIDSLNLFDLDELIIFSFYYANRNRYRRVLDIGANIGLHSIIMSKCGYDVRTYEPDPTHFKVLRNNLILNQSENVETHNAAVSSQSGEMEFVRVLGNTTGSHLAGSKPNPYGELERFPVKVEAFGPLIDWADLIKLDVEGHEKIVLLSTNREQWLGTEALVEIENESNAMSVYEHFQTLGINLFSQKTDWQLVRTPDDMPTGYREGTLFISANNKMPWGD